MLHALVLLVAGAVVAPMTVLEALVLGLVEGVTEYLPVSSTGHLILAQRAMGIAASEAANAFAIAIQAGAIVAVLWLYRGRVGQVARGVFAGDPRGRRVGLGLVVAFVPAAVLGLLLDDWIEERLFGLWPVVGAWFVGGVFILLLTGRKGREGASALPVDAVTPRMALWIGLMQCLALWPGTSRSLVTIAGGILAGFGLASAVEFSFLLGVITLGAATAYKALQSGGTMFAAYGAVPLLVGFLAAAVFAALAVHWLIRWITRHGLGLFGWYRIGLAALVAALLLLGVFETPGGRAGAAARRAPVRPAAAAPGVPPR